MFKQARSKLFLKVRNKMNKRKYFKCTAGARARARARARAGAWAWARTGR
jgi:hypothetical protein